MQGKICCFPLTMEFINKDGKLYRTRKGTKDIELIPESETKFFYSDGTDRQIEFELDANGVVKESVVYQHGSKGS